MRVHVGPTIPIAELARMPCGACGDLDSSCEGMTMRARCHPNAGTLVVYHKIGNSLAITCAKCGLPVVRILLGDSPS